MTENPVPKSQDDANAASTVQDDSLQSLTRSGVRWSGTASVCVLVTQCVTTAALARILSPGDFGVATMAFVVLGLVQGFADIGITGAVIHFKTISDRELSTLYWLNMLVGLCLCGIVIGIGVPAARFFGEESLAKCVILGSLTLVVTPVGHLFRVLYQKELDFRPIAAADIVSAVGYSVAAILLALAGAGPFSLIGGQVFRLLVANTLLAVLYLRKWKPMACLDVRSVSRFLRFGAFQLGERTLNYVTSNIDYLLVGRFLGKEALGYYSLAYQLMIFPLMKLNPIVVNVAMPAFAKLQNVNSRLQRGYAKVIRFVSLLAFPILAGAFLVATDFVFVVFGEKWDPVVPVLRAFCLLGVLKALGNPVGAVLVAKGRADLGFYWNALLLVCTAVVVSLSVRYGILGVSVALVAMNIPVFFLIQRATNALIGLNMRRIASAVLPAFLCTLCMSVCTAVVSALMAHSPALPRLLTVMFVGVVVYGAAFLRIAGDDAQDMWHLVSGR